MGKGVTLGNVIYDLPNLDPENTIYARKPWTADSPTFVGLESDLGEIPEKAKELGLVYFLEVSIAQDVLSDLPKALGRSPTYEEEVLRLISYATDDA